MKNEINEAIEAVEKNSDLTKKRKVVVPGEIIVTGDDYLPGDGARRNGEHIVASRFGLAEESGKVIKVIAIFGAFVPRKNNVVIGRIIDLTFNGWLVDIDSATNAFLPLDEVPKYVNKGRMDQFLNIGEVISAKILFVKSKSIDLTLKGRGLGKLEEGFIFNIVPSRVPRIIGKDGSMINLIKEKTDCQIIVGRNGWIWIKGPSIESEIKARKIIEFVSEKVHINNLTKKVEEWFENN